MTSTICDVYKKEIPYHPSLLTTHVFTEVFVPTRNIIIRILSYKNHSVQVMWSDEPGQPEPIDYVGTMGLISESRKAHVPDAFIEACYEILLAEERLANLYPSPLQEGFRFI